MRALDLFVALMYVHVHALILYKRPVALRCHHMSKMADSFEEKVDG